MKVGYARVSTIDQHLDLQLNALGAAGCSTVFQDHGISGVDTTRPGLIAALEHLKPGDTLVVWRLDRLGRSLIHLVSTVSDLSGRGIDLQSLTEAIDTGTPAGKLIFHIFAALAEFERHLISERTVAGVAAARAKGHRPGRPPRINPEQLPEIRRAYFDDHISLSDIADRYEVHPRTVRRHLQRTHPSCLLGSLRGNQERFHEQEV